MKILVTGGAGFIGGHLVDALIKKNHRVFIIDNLSTGRRENINSEAGFYQLDINDLKVNEVFDKEKPEIVYHLAFNTNVPLAVQDPFYDIKSLTGSLNIIENCRRVKVNKIIFTSSGFIYGNAKEYPTKETEPFQPLSPYGISKYAVEQYLHFYKNSHNLPFVIFRPATVYGPRQVSMALSDYINKISINERAKMYGSSPKTRDYLYVQDAVSALLLGLEREFDAVFEPIFNIGTSKETSLTEIYSLVADFLLKKNIPVYEPARTGELERYCLDYSKFSQLTGWRPKYDLKTGLKEVLKSRKLLS